MVSVPYAEHYPDPNEHPHTLKRGQHVKGLQV